jgi:DNA-binding transcriptional ArsR family regulator
MIIEEKFYFCSKKDTVPEVAEHFNFILSALSPQLKDADLITQKKEGKKRFYSLNRKKTLELVEFFQDMHKYNSKSLKEYIENKQRKRK